MLYLVAQLAIPLAGLRPSRSPPFAARFSWSMFAGPPNAHCAHRMDYFALDGSRVALPLPPVDHPAYNLLTMQSPGVFSRAVETLLPYARDDDAIADALDDLVTRYKRTVDPLHNHTLVSSLDCTSPLAAPVHRVLRIEAVP